VGLCLQTSSFSSADFRLEKAPEGAAYLHHSQACVQGDCNNNLPVVAAGSKP